MKENCVIFDTNILNENKLMLTTIKEKITSFADIMIPRMVIEEIEGQKSRVIRDDYNKIKSLIDKNSSYFKYEEKFKLDDSLTKNEKDIAKWFETYCDNNILEYGNISLKDITSRAKYKLPPFINENGSSDKGFKDTIIWLSILNSEKLNSYKKVVFVTNDKTGFGKNIKELFDEYNANNDNSIVICSSIEELYKVLNIEDSNANVIIEDLQQEKMDFEDIMDLKRKLNDCLNKLLYTTYEDAWGNSCTEQNFNIYTKVNIKDIEYFLESLDNYLKENIFFNYLDITELLQSCGIDSAGENVSSEDLSQLNSIYHSLKNNENLLNPLLIFLQKEFNKLYKFKSTNKELFADIDSGELPF